MYQVHGILYSGVNDLNKGFLSCNASFHNPLCLSNYLTVKNNNGSKYICAYAVDLKLLDGDESLKSQHIQQIDTKKMCRALGLTYPIKNGAEIATFLANKQTFGRVISSAQMAENALKSWFLNTPFSMVNVALKKDISKALGVDGYVEFDGADKAHYFMVANFKKIKPIAYQENKKGSSWCITQQMPSVLHKSVRKNLFDHIKEG